MLYEHIRNVIFNFKKIKIQNKTNIKSEITQKKKKPKTSKINWFIWNQNDMKRIHI